MNLQIYCIDSVFLLLEAAILWSAWRTNVNVAVTAYILFFIVFTQLIEFIPTPETAIRQNADIRIATDSMCLIHVFLITLLAWFTPNISIGAGLVTVLADVPTRASLGAILSWYAIKSYLLLKYGLAGFALIQAGLSTDNSEQIFSYSDFALSTLGATLFLGGILIFVVKAASGNLVIGHRLLWIFNLISLALYLFLGEAIVGARRTLVVIAIFALIAFIAKRGISISQLIKQHGGAVSVVLFFVIALAAYYETIRFNIVNPQFTAELQSNSYEQKLNAAILLVTPTHQDNLNKDRFFRPGPFTVIYDVVDRSLFHHVIADGSLTRHSLEKVLPRFIDPDKPMEDIDGYMAERLGIAPHELTVDIDLANSNLAIMLGDFGIIGVLFASLASFLPIFFFSFALVKYSKYFSATILAAGGLFASVGNVEGTLSTALAFIRDFFIWGVIFVSLEWLVRAFYRRSPVRDSIIAPL